MRAAIRICASAIGLLLAMATASLGSDFAATAVDAAHDQGDTATQAGCCRVCTRGKACGNSCISRDKQCYQPPGCACDG